MGKILGKWKVKKRKNCKVCGNEIIGSRFRTYCSKRCRYQEYNIRYREKHNEWKKQNYQKKLIKDGKELVQCLICGKWFVQVGSHIVQAHSSNVWLGNKVVLIDGFKTCREYREWFDLERKRGVVPGWYRKIKGDIALENKTYKNLVAGKKYWFRSGDKMAGNYIRSYITMERLKNMGKNNKIYDKDKRKSILVDKF